MANVDLTKALPRIPIFGDPANMPGINTSFFASGKIIAGEVSIADDGLTIGNLTYDGTAMSSSRVSQYATWLQRHAFTRSGSAVRLSGTPHPFIAIREADDSESSARAYSILNIKSVGRSDGGPVVVRLAKNPGTDVAPTAATHAVQTRTPYFLTVPQGDSFDTSQFGTLLNGAANPNVDAANTPATGHPGIQGLLRVGQVLTGIQDTVRDADGVDASSFKWQWFRTSNDVQATRTAATDAPSSTATYTLVDADLNHKMSVVLTFADNAGNTEARESPLSGVVDAAIPDDTPATGHPEIQGEAVVGETLQAVIGTVADADGINLDTLEWQFSRTLGGQTLIVQARGDAAEYRVKPEDERARIAVTVFFQDNHGYPQQRQSEGTTNRVRPAPIRVGETLAIQGAGSQGEDYGDRVQFFPATFTYQGVTFTVGTRLALQTTVGFNVELESSDRPGEAAMTAWAEAAIQPLLNYPVQVGIDDQNVQQILLLTRWRIAAGAAPFEVQLTFVDAAGNLPRFATNSRINTRLYFITNPGRVDSDGFQQPAVPEGLLGALAAGGRFDNTQRGTLKVLRSSIRTGRPGSTRNLVINGETVPAQYPAQPTTYLIAGEAYGLQDPLPAAGYVINGEEWQIGEAEQIAPEKHVISFQRFQEVA